MDPVENDLLSGCILRSNADSPRPAFQLIPTPTPYRRHARRAHATDQRAIERHGGKAIAAHPR